MKRIIIGVICTLAILSISFFGVAAGHKKKKLKGGQTFKIEVIDENNKTEKIEFVFKGFDPSGIPIVEDKQGNPWGSQVPSLPAGAEEVISIHYVNPPCIRINGVPRCI
jgi:hypothetical protein